jgi:hypothetical protein
VNNLKRMAADRDTVILAAQAKEQAALEAAQEAAQAAAEEAAQTEAGDSEEQAAVNG